MRSSCHLRSAARSCSQKSQLGNIGINQPAGVLWATMELYNRTVLVHPPSLSLAAFADNKTAPKRDAAPCGVNPRCPVAARMEVPTSRDIDCQAESQLDGLHHHDASSTSASHLRHCSVSSMLPLLPFRRMRSGLALLKYRSAASPPFRGFSLLESSANECH